MIAITGASGYIGGYTAQKILSLGLELRLLVRVNSDIRRFSTLPSLTARRVNFLNTNELRDALQGVSTVIHTAGPGLSDCIKLGHKLSESVSPLLKAATDSGCSRFIYLSTVKARAPRNLHSSYGPTDVYGQLKKEEESLVQESSMDWTIVRAAAVFGHGDKKTYPIFRNCTRRTSLLLDNNAMGRFSLTPIDSLADALINCTSTSDHQQKIIEIGSLQSFSWNDLVHLLAPPSANYLRVPTWLLRTSGKISSALARAGLNVALVSPRVNDLLMHDWAVIPNLSPKTGYARSDEMARIKAALQSVQDGYKQSGQPS